MHQDSATACAAWSASNATDDECMWNAEDEMCEMVMGEDDMDGSGSGSSDETEPEESVCFGDDLREDADACNANAACMWEAYDMGDPNDADDDPIDQPSGMCAEIRCGNQVRVAGISRPSLLPVSILRMQVYAGVIVAMLVRIFWV